MNFDFLSEVPRPLGLEAETAVIAKGLRQKYADFFVWVQGEETEAGVNELSENEQIDIKGSEVHRSEAELEAGENTNTNEEPWLLDKADVEYFYHLSRPVDVGCACPYGWVEKVERVVDQQYPTFGVERFPDLYDKAAHILWLILKNEVFSDYNAGVAALSALVLLEKNDRMVHLSDDGLRVLIKKARLLIGKSKEDLEYEEDEAIRYLGSILKRKS